jgi:hypothetical protein
MVMVAPGSKWFGTFGTFGISQWIYPADPKILSIALNKTSGLKGLWRKADIGM